ncbi:MAG TPA: hypothetical protein VF268_13700 [Gammaproteobacteria bacterium]
MRILFIIVTAGLLTGCTFTMVTNGPKTEAATVHKKTVNATFARSEPVENLCVDENKSLAQIRFHTNPAYLLASLLSFGLYVPQNVTWWCDSEPVECEDGDTSGDCEPYVPGDE